MPTRVAITLLTLLIWCARSAGAQCYEPPANQTPIVTIQPNHWAPGQTYNVTLTNSQGYFAAYTPPAGFIPATGFALTASDYSAGNYSSEDQFVTIGPLTLVGPTQITFTATVKANAPTEGDGFAIPCLGNILNVSPNFISITPCAYAPTPTISSIQPAAWFAGQATPVTITGTNFIPSSNPGSCAPTTPYGTAGSESLTFSNVTVVSATQITATITASATDPAESASIGVSNNNENGPPYFVASPTLATGTVLPLPTIVLNSTGVAISGTKTAAVVFTGQTVNLSTTPSSLPNGYNVTQSIWTVGGTNIGGYQVIGPTDASPTVSTAVVQPTVLTNPSLVTYFTAQATKIPVTYQYCTNITGSSTACSPIATGYVTTTGPKSVKVAVTNKTFSADLLPPEELQWNIDFSATATAPTTPTSNAGVYTWVQLATSIVDTQQFSDGSAKSCTGGPALDTAYPYLTGMSSDDNPADLLNSPNQTGANDTRQFQMYLLWNPGTDAASIPVALGSISWEAKGSVSYNATTKTWGSGTGSTTAASFVASSNQPQWGSALTGLSISASCR